jgi:hypothetical protein
MGCFQGEKQQLELAMPESQRMLYEKMASIIGGQMKNYQTPPMYMQGPNPGQLGAMDYVMRQLGYGGYQSPGMYTMPSQSVPMMPQAGPGAASPGLQPPAPEPKGRGRRYSF